SRLSEQDARSSQQKKCGKLLKSNVPRHEVRAEKGRGGERCRTGNGFHALHFVSQSDSCQIRNTLVSRLFLLKSFPFLCLLLLNFYFSPSNQQAGRSGVRSVWKQRRQGRDYEWPRG